MRDVTVVPSNLIVFWDEPLSGNFYRATNAICNALKRRKLVAGVTVTISILLAGGKTPSYRVFRDATWHNKLKKVIGSAGFRTDP